MKSKNNRILKIAASVLLLISLAEAEASAADVNTLWALNCVACHGKDGIGNTRMGRKLQILDFTNPQDQASFTDAKAADSIHNGITKNGIEKMKAFGDKLSDDEIKALIEHVRSFK